MAGFGSICAIDDTTQSPLELASRNVRSGAKSTRLNPLMPLSTARSAHSAQSRRLICLQTDLYVPSRPSDGRVQCKLRDDHNRSGTQTLLAHTQLPGRDYAANEDGWQRFARKAHFCILPQLGNRAHSSPRLTCRLLTQPTPQQRGRSIQLDGRRTCA